MNGGPSGFNNAPITRTFIIGCALFTILFGIQGRSNKLGLSYQDIFKQLRPWKLLASIFAFSSTPELMFGLYLLYYFRVFERQIGSNKYSVFILFSIFGSLLFEVLTLALLRGSSLNMISSGPYGVLFSSFVPFFLDIPVSTRFRVFGLHFSDKSFIYLAGIQLLLSSWKKSIVPGICGILVGSLYRLNILGIRRLKSPDFIASFFSRLSFSSTGSTPSAAPSRHVLGNLPPYTHRQAQSNNNNYQEVSSSSSAPTIEPTEESIATLVSMGFDMNHARQALVQAGNDVNAATNILLEAQTQ
ncbi:rhomboid-like protein 20 [Impatiens glandulifera]|uniref:rhomboid-like protein 20 n=1 Tax=Impatiens glandulifera TaxID=253017 RepID=UPI001FB166CF|nr:rhomboid-like protein 20 [Impatiens glandulifera]